MELDDLYNEFFEHDIKWISLLHQKEDIVSYKDIICKTSELWERSCGYLKNWWTYKWKFAKLEYLLSIKGQLFEWHLKRNSLCDARLDSIVVRISDEEIKMAKMRNQAKAMDSDHEQAVGSPRI
jgi:hypothetical protein